MTGILLTNARIYTLDSLQPTAAALAIEGGRVLAIGTTERLLSEFSSRLEVAELPGEL